MTRPKKNLLAIALLMLSASAIAAGAVAPRFLAPPLADNSTLCPTDRPLSAHTIILVDKTDPLTPAQRDELRRLMEQVRGHLRLYERLSLVPITGVIPERPPYLFSLCNPGDRTSANPLIANPEQRQKRFEESFGRPLQEVLDQLMKGTSAPHSPIMETIQLVAEQPDFSPAVSERTLIVFSDLLQNMPDYTQYRPFGDFASFAGSAYGKRTLARLAGMRINLVYLSNRSAPTRQGPKHLAFWHRWFAAAGANEVSEIAP